MKVGIGVVVWVLLASGCGPTINETRMQAYPSRGKTCELEFVKLDMNALSSPQGTWQVIGYVSIGDGGTQDPFSEDLRAIVRPRACSMGGEGVTVMMNSVNQVTLVTASAVTYGVLRHRTVEDNTPKKF